MKRHDLRLPPETDPTALYRYRDGLYAVDLLTVALVQLDLFTLLSREPASKAAICKDLGLADRPADVMLTLLVAMELLQKDEDGLFHVTSLAEEHLVEGSPFYMGPYYNALRNGPVCQDLLRVLKTGKPANWGSTLQDKDWAGAMEGEAFAEQFTGAMDCRGRFLAPALAKALDLKNSTRLLDIAGGSGVYACALVAAHPHLRAAVLEKPPVDEIARRAIQKRDLDDKVDVVTGDMLQDALPSEFDVHLFSNVLHDWDEPVVKDLLAKSYAALPPGGLLVIHDAHINATKSGPLPVAKYSVLLMHSTEGKCYSITEVESYLTALGFAEVNYRATVADRSFISARRPRE